MQQHLWQQGRGRVQLLLLPPSSVCVLLSARHLKHQVPAGLLLQGSQHRSMGDLRWPLPLSVGMMLRREFTICCRCARQVSLVLLEEPEHLNWYRAGSRWSNQFRCGVPAPPVWQQGQLATSVPPQHV